MNSKPVSPAFRKEHTKHGWFVYRLGEYQPVNSIPISEWEADEIIKARE